MAKKTKEKIEMFTLVSIFLIALFSVVDVRADEMVHQFKNPSFSGIGTSAHYLTIENQEFNRKKAIKEEIKALLGSDLKEGNLASRLIIYLMETLPGNPLVNYTRPLGHSILSHLPC